MDKQQHQNGGRAVPLSARLDRAAGELNVFLLVLAIGLATLDFTCFFAFKVRDALPPAAGVVSAAPTLITRPAAAQDRPVAAARPTTPGVSATGW